MRDFAEKTGIACLAIALSIIISPGLYGDSDGERGKVKLVKLIGYPAENALVDTLRVGFFKELNKKVSFWGREYPGYAQFFDRGDEDSLAIFDDKPEMNYKVWMQEGEKAAPMVIILPGTAVHFNGDGLVAMAQVFYESGFSVVGISSPLNWEFMESASSVDTPGFATQDAADISNAIQKLVPHLRDEYPDRISNLILAGYSLGALHTLIISDMESREKKIGFSRFVAINPPVNLMHSMDSIDHFYDKWRGWPGDKVQYNINQAADVYLSILDDSITPAHRLDITQEQAEFIIGLAFRMQLSEAIYSLYRRGKDFGNISESWSWSSRDSIYREIRKYSYREYIVNFVARYYSSKLGRDVTIDELNEKSGLRAMQKSLSGNPDIRIFHNMDDFIISDSDCRWLMENIGGRLTLFDHGGHLGNLYLPQVQRKIVESVLDLLGGSPAGGTGGTGVEKKENEEKNDADKDTDKDNGSEEEKKEELPENVQGVTTAI